MVNFTAAELLMVNESIRSASVQAQKAAAEAQTCQDPELRQILQSEHQRHLQGLQRMRMLVAGPGAGAQ